mmetsp:Transcript_24000/g.73510  ORF Transcript_24000/g.73510 Transcript_24000/m.73510 type:complete len:108 (-) Transcript_24000:574-897(-)
MAASAPPCSLVSLALSATGSTAGCLLNFGSSSRSWLLSPLRLWAWPGTGMENGEEEGRYEPMAPVKKGRRERARLFERSLLLLRLLAEGEEAQVLFLLLALAPRFLL